MCCCWLFLHLRRVSSGASRSPSHKKPTGIMLPPFPYPSLRLLASLPALLASFSLILFPYFLNLDTKPGFFPLFPPQVSFHALPFPAFLLLKLGSSIHAFANAPVRSTMKNTSRVKCRGFACGGGKPRFRHLCPDCGKRFCPKCVRPSSRHACLPMVPAAVPPSEESELLTNKTIGIARCEL